MRGSSLVELTGHDNSAADIMAQMYSIYVVLHSWYIIICTGTAVSIHNISTDRYSTANNMYVCMYGHHL